MAPERLEISRDLVDLPQRTCQEADIRRGTMAIRGVDDLISRMMRLQAEQHRRAYVRQTEEESVANSARANADAKNHTAKRKVQNYERTHGADPKRAATLVGVDTMFTASWFKSDDEKIY